MKPNVVSKHVLKFDTSGKQGKKVKPREINLARAEKGRQRTHQTTAQLDQR
jgi:hypothetical protein